MTQSAALKVHKPKSRAARQEEELIRLIEQLDRSGERIVARLTNINYQMEQIIEEMRIARNIKQEATS